MKFFSLQSRAFTLIEILSVIAILLVILVIIVSAFSSFSRAASVNASAQIVFSALDEARIKTLASQSEMAYGVHFDVDQVVIFSGVSYDNLDLGNEIKFLSRNVSISSITLEGGGSEVMFNRLTGKTAQYGTLEISSSVINDTRTITIEETGLSK